MMMDQAARSPRNFSICCRAAAPRAHRSSCWDGMRSQYSGNSPIACCRKATTLAAIPINISMPGRRCLGNLLPISMQDMSSLSRWIQPDGMFRPPYGKITLPTYWSLRRRNAPVWWWTIDSGDTRKVLPNPQQIADKLRKEGGGIVLMHDLDRTQERNRLRARN